MNTEHHVRDRDHHHDGRHGTVEVFLDIQETKQIPPGTYSTAELKKLLGVDPSLDLDVINEHGAFRTLTDADHTKVKEHERFISHVKKGGSS